MTPSISVEYVGMKKPEGKRVVVATNIEKASRRDCLSGILRFTRECVPWRLKILQTDERLNPQSLTELDIGGIDGVITSESGVEEVRALVRRSDLPVVSIGTRPDAGFKRMSRIASVRIDDAEIGRFGAESLCSYGQFAACAFVLPWRKSEWADLRARSFRSEFMRLNRCQFFSHEGNERLEEWLSNLPKPAAVMAANDMLAFSVLEAAAAAKIPVPQSLAVIGVDNDVFLCDMAKPSLTSILPDHEEVGFAAASALHRLMRSSGAARPRETLCRGHRLIERESSRHIPPAARIIREALSFIEAHAKQGIVPSDVARHLGVSRRLLDLRFGEFCKKTVMETIRDCRLNAVMDLLENTNLPIGQITAQCGFTGESYPKDLFKRRFGASMRQWRASRRH